MTHVLLARDPLRKNDHRLVWWLLTNQGRDAAGVPNGQLAAGWRAKAMADLNMDKPDLWWSQERLKAVGLLECESHEKTARIIGEAFHIEPSSA